MNQDDLKQLCGLNGTTPTGSLAQHPPDLFKYLEIDNNKCGVDRPGWGNAHSRLREMLACPAALHDVEHLKVHIWVSDGQYGLGHREPSKPPGNLLALFVHALTSMPNLRKLDWETFDNGIKEFKQAFADANLTLPSVRQLILGQSAEFLVDSCSHTDDLRSGGSSGIGYFSPSYGTEPSNPPKQLINSARRLSNLTTFGMTGEWQTEYLEGKSMQHGIGHALTSLSTLRSETWPEGSSDGRRDRANVFN